MLERYGVSNPSQLPSHKKVMDRVNAKRKEMFASGELVPHFKGQTKETNPTLKRVAEELSKKRKEQYASGELVPWNKGLTKEDSESLMSISRKVSKRKKRNETLEYSYDLGKVVVEFGKFLVNNLSYTTNKKNNNLILPFVWEIFYQKELEMWKDESVRKMLIQNRCTYLHKLEKDLTDNELLVGFSRSLIHKGYSSFSPFVMKSFIQEYNISSIYDPCGGWGHRMLGAWDIRYHYNDFNSELVKAIEKMHEFYNEISSSGEKTFSCEDASAYVPEGKFDAVFTCPPYFNTEDYMFEGDSSSVFPEYEDWLNTWWRNVVKRGKQVSDTFAYVISNKYSEDMNRILEEEDFVLDSKKLVSSGRANHMNTSAVEHLYIFRVN